MEKIKIWINKFINLVKTNSKVKHLLCNFIIVIIFGLISPVFGVGIALIVSLLKETYDEYKEENLGWNWDNIVADIIGIILGLTFIL